MHIKILIIFISNDNKTCWEFVDAYQEYNY